ncbi:hypothetical protein J3R83DRAFT_3027 [Lanmaoa asiatica]|nr:hypothetical protein J3R83DRAFT_3027 [Lanmaoa asiatica]
MAVIALQLMTDARMIRRSGQKICRCRVIWDSSLAIVVPSILWVATLSEHLSAPDLWMINPMPYQSWESSTQKDNFLLSRASKIGLVYYTVMVFLNVILTGAICRRLVRYGRVAKRLGHECTSLYFSVATLVIESMLPYTLRSGIAFLVSFGFKDVMLMPFMSAYMMMMVRGLRSPRRSS